jgi:serine/threonine protein kinase/tetratricopeptide (TPR) repeat protein
VHLDGVEQREPAASSRRGGGDMHTMSSMPTRSLARGDLLGRYVVLERLGVGGMGEVFAAYDPQLDRKIAVKLLLPTSAGSHASRLLREAQAMAKLRHPNVVTVHDVGTHDERVFVAMEFVEGGTLADWMLEGRDGRGTPHAWRLVLERFDAAGRGLAAAHAAKLVHRDFKPANVLVSAEGQVRVADFGLVRRSLDEHDDAHDEPASREVSGAALLAVHAGPTPALDDDATLAPDTRAPTSSGATPSLLGVDSLSLRMTQTGATLGTPAYMAPEQYAGREVDARADQFSFCVAVWEALYGQRPFGGDSLHTLMFAIEQGRVREPPHEREVPTAIRKALVRGLARDPAARWPDMTALLAALRCDPVQVRRRRLGVALGLVLVVGGPALATLLEPEPPPSAAPPPPPCTGAAAALGDALSPARRDALARHFEGLEHAWASELAERLLPRLDAWALSWQHEWTDACEDTRVRGEQSEALLDRRMLCLDRRRRRFVELVDSLTVADVALAKTADVALDDLGALAACADIDALLRVTPLPNDPAKVDAILRIEHAVDSAHLSYHVSEFPEALALLEPRRSELAALDYPPLTAAFRHIDGRLKMETDDVLGGERELEQAFVTALAAGDDALAIEVARSLATALNELDRSADALRWLDIAAALAQRNPDDDTLANLALTRSQSLGHLGEREAAEAAAREAYERYVRSGKRPASVGDALYLLGLADYRAGRSQQAIRHVEQAREVWAASIGPRHPRNVSALSLLGAASRGLGNYDDARRYFEEVLTIKIDLLGPEHREVASARMNLAVVLGDLGKLDESAAELERVIAMRRALPETTQPELARALINRAETLRLAGRVDEAALALDEGEPLLRGELDADHPDLVTVGLIRAQLELERDNLRVAERSAHDALRIAELELAGTPALCEVYTIVAKVALASRDARAAKRLLDRSLALHVDDPLVRGQRDAVLAQTLVALGRRDEGLTLARATITVLEPFGRKVSREVATLARLLDPG